MKKLALLLIGLLSACGGGLHAHVDAVRIVPTLYTTPSVPMVQADMRITCILPESNGIPATFAWGITDIFQSSGPADTMQLTKVLSTPCQPFRVYCAYQEHGNKPVSTYLDITPAGECGAATTK